MKGNKNKEVPEILSKERINRIWENILEVPENE